MVTTNATSQGIAEVVTGALSEAGIAQRDAAARTGIPFTTLRRRLTGYSPFNMAELVLIADLLGQPLSSLIQMAEAA